jgi:hypothetical protein
MANMRLTERKRETMETAKIEAMKAVGYSRLRHSVICTNGTTIPARERS